MRTKNLGTINRFFLSFALALFFLSYSSAVFACDPCALYNASRLSGHEEGTFSLALSEQFTNYERTTFGRTTSAADAEFTKSYSSTQLSAAYDFSNSFALQFSLPFITRTFVKRQRFRESDDEEAGIGDVVLAGSFSPLTVREVDRALVFFVTGGVKLPTGDTGALSELNDAAPNTARDGSTLGDTSAALFARREVAAASLAHHNAVTSGAAGGRILTIGSGSIDYILASSLVARWERTLLLGSLQYTIRSEGDFEYRFDNDLLWSLTPAQYVFLGDEFTLALGTTLSGEHKGRDTLDGEKIPGSALANVYLGPQLITTASLRWTADLALELPVLIDHDDSSLKPDWRLRAGMGYRF